MTMARRRLTWLTVCAGAVLLVAAGCGDEPAPRATTDDAPTRAIDDASSGDSVAGDVEADRSVDAAASYDGQVAPIITAVMPVARRAGAVAGTSGRATPIAAIRRQERAARALAQRARAVDTADAALLDASMQLAEGIDALGATFDELAALATTPAASRDAVLSRAGVAFEEFTAHVAAFNDALDADGRDFPRATDASDQLGDVLATLELG